MNFLSKKTIIVEYHLTRTYEIVCKSVADEK